MTYHITSFLFMTLVLLTYAIQRLVVIPRVWKELYELNMRRGDRVQQALAGDDAPAFGNWTPSPCFPFDGWLDLLPNGSLKIAGETFQITNSFQATAKDDHNILRATVLCPGNGDVLIHSHGQSFVARFVNKQWQVQPTGLQAT